MRNGMMQGPTVILPPLDRSVEGLFVGVGTLLLFTVKLNLLAVPGQTAGLRIDDLILALIGAWLTAAFLAMGRTVVYRLESLALAVFLLFVASNLYNVFLFSRSNLLYSLRFGEYFLFFYIGYYYARKHSLRSLAGWLLVINALVMILQAAGVLGGYSSEGYEGTGLERVVGLTGGPWEVGTLLNFWFAILLKRTGKAGLRNFFLFLATFLLVLLTAARMPAVAHLCIYSLFLLRRARKPGRVLAVVTVGVLLVLVLIFTVPNPVQARSANLLSGDNISAFTDAYKNITPGREISGIPWVTTEQGADVSGADDLDLSWAIRLVKWTYMLKLWVITPSAWLVGLGPGVSGPALDGAWLRLLVETGVFGVFAFAAFLFRISKIDEITECLVLGLIINMLMTDVHIAYKVMSFLFFTVGYCYRKRRRSWETVGSKARIQISPRLAH